MLQLTTSEAVALVRKNLDELDPNGSIMYDDENGSADEYGDNMSLDDIIRRNLPEAINSVHRVAPVVLLEGVEHEFTDADKVSITEDGVLSVALPSSSKMLRLVAFQAADSHIVVTDALAEASPEGRKQLNPYIRGRADRPRLVLLQGRITGPVFRYYTLTDASAFMEGNNPAYADGRPAAISQFSYVEEQLYHSDATGYPISRMLRQNIIDQLTAMVMETYGDQRATNFHNKANAF